MFRDPSADHPLVRIAGWLLTAFVFVVPIFFLPADLLPIQFAKSIVIAGGVALILMLYVFSVMRRGECAVPVSPWLFVIPVVPLIYLLSALLSGAVSSSVVGSGFEVATFGFIAVQFLLLVLVLQLVTSVERMFYIYLAFWSALVLIAVYHIVRFIGGADILSFGIFTEVLDNTVGAWNDLAVFLGVGVIMLLVSLEELTLSRAFRIGLQVLFGLALVLLAIINFSLIWYVLGGFALIYFAYLIPAKAREHTESSEMSGFRQYLSVHTLVVVAVSIVFVIAGSQINAIVSDYLSFSSIDVRPSWSSTWDIASRTISDRPVLGAGPNRFLNQWQAFKPAGVNQSTFWDTNFHYGIGLVPTFLVTNGILGFIAWIGLLGVLVYLGVRALYRREDTSLRRYLTVSSFAVTLFLWCMAIVYVPSAVVMTTTFLFTGLFLASLVLDGVIERRRVAFTGSPRMSFGVIFVMVAVLLATVGYSFVVTQHGIAFSWYRVGNTALAAGNLDKAERAIQEARSWSGEDLFMRSLSRLHLARARSVVTQRENEQLSQQETEAFRSAYQAAVEAARVATERDATNYRNWMQLGDVYRQGVIYGVTGTYAEAQRAYESALERNPRSPAVLVRQARLEIANEDLEQAHAYVTQAREAKPNYLEAIYLDMQLAIRRGNTDQAIRSAQAAVRVSPRDPNGWFRLGVLLFNQENYEQAARAFQRTLQLQQGSANARYFYAVSLWNIDERDAATRQMQQLAERFPDNDQVQRILSRMRQGSLPSSAAPADGGGEELPVDESDQ